MKTSLKFRIIGFVVLLSLLLYGCTTIQVQPKPVEPTPVQNITLTPSSLCASDETFFPNFTYVEKCQPTSDVKACEIAGGNWRVFGDGCGDSCGEKPRLCTLAFEAACDCGPTKCWNSVNCIVDIYEPYGTPKEACEAINGTWINETTLIRQTCIVIENGTKVCEKEVTTRLTCRCSVEGHTFGLQGCKEYPNVAHTEQLMSIVGDWN